MAAGGARSRGVGCQIQSGLQLGHPIAKPNEIPVECGVMVFQNKQFEVTRMAPIKTVSQLPFSVWMELAKATPRRRSDLENP
jgi:hypothetical protein